MITAELRGVGDGVPQRFSAMSVQVTSSAAGTKAPPFTRPGTRIAPVHSGGPGHFCVRGGRNYPQQKFPLVPTYRCGV